MERRGFGLMCLGYPAQVVEVDPGLASAVVDDRGRRRRTSTVLIDRVAIGDWVLVAAGNVIRRLDPDDAAGMAAELARAAAATKLPPQPQPPSGASTLTVAPSARPQGDLS